MKKVFYRVLAASVMLLAMAGWVACSDDDPNDNGTNPLPARLSDVVDGRILHFVDIDSLEAHKLPISSLQQVTVTAKENAYIGVRKEDINGTQYAVPYLKKAMEKPVEVVRVKVEPKGKPEQGRHVFFVFVDKKQLNQTRAEDAITTSYSEIIGKSTYCFNATGSVKNTLLDPALINALPAGYLTAETNNSEELCFYKECEGYTKTMTDWAFNLGVTMSAPKKERKRFIFDEVKGIFTWGQEPPKWQISGAFDLGLNGSSMASEDYECFIECCLVKKATLKLNMSLFERENPDTMLMHIVTEPFVESLNTTAETFSPSTFYDDWGTDLIHQGTFGGMFLYLYGRTENCYENSVGVDATASLDLKKKGSASAIPNDLSLGAYAMTKLLAQAQDHFSVSAGGTYTQDNYEQASNAQSISYSKGGGDNLNDEKTWAAGFADNKNWALVSYRTGYKGSANSINQLDSAATDEDELCLYPIHYLINDLASIIYTQLADSATQEDLNVVKNMLAIANALGDARQQYLERNCAAVKKKSKLILADFYMKAEDFAKGNKEISCGHEAGGPKPFVDKDPRNDKKYLIYYPMMANVNAPVHDGYAVETADEGYLNTLNSKCHYWYYALDRADENNGIAEISFAYSDHDYSKYSWSMRGDGCHDGLGVAGQKHKGRYVWIRWYDKSNPDDQQITAAGLYIDKEEDPEHIVATTGGSEYAGHTVGEFREWSSFWEIGDSTTYKTTDWTSEGVRFGDHHVRLVYTTKELPTRNTRNVVHPKAWDSNGKH